MRKFLCEFGALLQKLASRLNHDYRCPHGYWPGVGCPRCKAPERQDICIHCGELAPYQRTRKPSASTQEGK